MNVERCPCCGAPALRGTRETLGPFGGGSTPTWQYIGDEAVQRGEGQVSREPKEPT